MSKFSEYIGSQFGNPHGLVGSICCLIMNIINKAMYKRTVALIESGADDRVLDIGYGNGYLLKYLYRKTKSQLYGIDISEDMLKKASRKNREAARQGKLHLQTGDCCALSYEDNFFTAVTSINTVYFWQDTVKGLSEIKRVLKPGCSFYNVVYTKEFLDALSYTNKGFKKFESAQLVSLGKEAGFENAEVKDIVKGKSFVVIYTKNF
ncbi:MAG: class I SAM-dependent methyltransferase [Treponema sp.]|nr:class I SAM-dependent methyltransferase [Treponema sp.]MCR5316694.1 class I SAM-dependent methyltransferase [Treponema sp.]